MILSVSPITKIPALPWIRYGNFLYYNGQTGSKGAENPVRYMRGCNKSLYKTVMSKNVMIANL